MLSSFTNLVLKMKQCVRTAVRRLSLLIFLYLSVYFSLYADITTTAPPTTAIASTHPMTTFGATTTAPITIPGSTATSDCDEGQRDCGGETDAPDDYNTATGKPPKLQSKEFLSRSLFIHDLFT